MRLNATLAVFSLGAIGIVTSISHAADNPSAHLQGYRCEVISLPDSPNTTIVVCQIDEDGDPILHAAYSPGLPPKRDAVLDFVRRELLSIKESIALRRSRATPIDRLATPPTP
jgi:hypothetical protein